LLAPSARVRNLESCAPARNSRTTWSFASNVVRTLFLVPWAPGEAARWRRDRPTLASGCPWGRHL